MKSPTPKAVNYEDIILIPKLNSISAKGLHLQPRRVKITKSVPLLPSASGQEESNKGETSTNWKTRTPSETPTLKAKYKKYEGCKQQ
jgi:hypothetical protein